ncbi:MAG TPA: cellobiose phosphorylase [Candidatus Fimivicinus intestinavium]|nr:cellobiose phosphorylase [Candidatus Fimivicinus intestinavium]
MDHQTNGAYRYEQGGDACVIQTPQPPRHWYNYLWNEDRYCAQVSQMGHGRSYYLNETADMCMLNQDDSRYVYLRDEQSKDVWCVGQGPVNTPVEDYACTHAIGYSQLSARRHGLRASWRLFVPRRGFHEVWTLSFTNEGDTTRHISVFSAVSFSLEGFSYPRYYEMYRCMHTFFDKELGGVFCDSSHPFAPHDHYRGLLASTKPPAAFDGDLQQFCGTDSTITQPDASVAALFQRPDVVMQGRDCTGSEAALFILGGVLQHKLTLLPGQTKEFHVFFGVASSLEDARRTVAAYRRPGAVQQAFEQAQSAYRQKYAALCVKTPDQRLNHLMNNWVKKQVDFCIVGKKGVRDNLQTAAALLDYQQDKAKEEILECLRHQFRDGHAVLTWYPYDDTRYSDQPFWIIWAVCRLVRETGDLSLLKLPVAWQDGGEDTVLAHVQAAVSRLIGDKGKNGLIRIFFADWNDALNITTDPEAESVMLSHQFCLAMRELAELADRFDPGYAAFLRTEYEMMKTAINCRAWDGSWYKRALSDKGDIGGAQSEGSRIYLNAQTWAMLADVSDGQRLTDVLEAVDGMEQEFGFPLNMPPYTRYLPSVGRMSGMLPGLFENGGVYCHASAFKILMDCKAGRGGQAVRTLKKIAPDSPQNPSTRSGAEPYVFTNCYATHPGYYGKSYQSWTTGTSAWCLMGLYEGILGVRAELDGLRIAPCLPPDWDGAEMNRRFRGADYHIVISRSNRKSVPQITVDGQLLKGTLVPPFVDAGSHEITVTL